MLARQAKMDFRPAPYIFIRNYNDNKNYAYNQKNQDTFLCEKILSLNAKGEETISALCPSFTPLSIPQKSKLKHPENPPPPEYPANTDDTAGIFPFLPR